MEELYKNICNNTTIKNYNKIRRLNLLNLLIQCQHFYKNENHSFDFIAPVLDNNTESKFIAEASKKLVSKDKIFGLLICDAKLNLSNKYCNDMLLLLINKYMDDFNKGTSKGRHIIVDYKLEEDRDGEHTIDMCFLNRPEIYKKSKKQNSRIHKMINKVYGKKAKQFLYLITFDNNNFSIVDYNDLQEDKIEEPNMTDIYFSTNFFNSSNILVSSIIAKKDNNNILFYHVKKEEKEIEYQENIHEVNRSHYNEFITIIQSENKPKSFYTMKNTLINPEHVIHYLYKDDYDVIETLLFMSDEERKRTNIFNGLIKNQTYDNLIDDISNRTHFKELFLMQFVNITKQFELSTVEEETNSVENILTGGSNDLNEIEDSIKTHIKNINQVHNDFHNIGFDDFSKMLTRDNLHIDFELIYIYLKKEVINKTLKESYVPSIDNYSKVIEELEDYLRIYIDSQLETVEEKLYSIKEGNRILDKYNFIFDIYEEIITMSQKTNKFQFNDNSIHDVDIDSYYNHVSFNNIIDYDYLPFIENKEKPIQATNAVLLSNNKTQTGGRANSVTEYWKNIQDDKKLIESNIDSMRELAPINKEVYSYGYFITSRIEKYIKNHDDKLTEDKYDNLMFLLYSYYYLLLTAIHSNIVFDYGKIPSEDRPKNTTINTEGIMQITNKNVNMNEYKLTEQNNLEKLAEFVIGKLFNNTNITSFFEIENSESNEKKFKRFLVLLSTNGYNDFFICKNKLCKTDGTLQDISKKNIQENIFINTELNNDNFNICIDKCSVPDPKAIFKNMSIEFNIEDTVIEKLKQILKNNKDGLNVKSLHKNIHNEPKLEFLSERDLFEILKKYTYVNSKNLHSKIFGLFKDNVIVEEYPIYKDEDDSNVYMLLTDELKLRQFCPESNNFIDFMDCLEEMNDDKFRNNVNIIGKKYLELFDHSIADNFNINENPEDINEFEIRKRYKYDIYGDSIDTTSIEHDTKEGISHLFDKLIHGLGTYSYEINLKIDEIIELEKNGKTKEDSSVIKKIEELNVLKNKHFQTVDNDYEKYIEELANGKIKNDNEKFIKTSSFKVGDVRKYLNPTDDDYFTYNVSDNEMDIIKDKIIERHKLIKEYTNYYYELSILYEFAQYLHKYPYNIFTNGLNKEKPQQILPEPLSQFDFHTFEYFMNFKDNYNDLQLVFKTMKQNGFKNKLFDLNYTLKQMRLEKTLKETAGAVSEFGKKDMLYNVIKTKLRSLKILKLINNESDDKETLFNLIDKIDKYIDEEMYGYNKKINYDNLGFDISKISESLSKTLSISANTEYKITADNFTKFNPGKQHFPYSENEFLVDSYTDVDVYSFKEMYLNDHQHGGDREGTFQHFKYIDNPLKNQKEMSNKIKKSTGKEITITYPKEHFLINHKNNLNLQLYTDISRLKRFRKFDKSGCYSELGIQSYQYPLLQEKNEMGIFKFIAPDNNNEDIEKWGEKFITGYPYDKLHITDITKMSSIKETICKGINSSPLLVSNTFFKNYVINSSEKTKKNIGFRVEEDVDEENDNELGKLKNILNECNELLKDLIDKINYTEESLHLWNGLFKHSIFRVRQITNDFLCLMIFWFLEPITKRIDEDKMTDLIELNTIFNSNRNKKEKKKKERMKIISDDNSRELHFNIHKFINDLIKQLGNNEKLIDKLTDYNNTWLIDNDVIKKITEAKNKGDGNDFDKKFMDHCLNEFKKNPDNFMKNINSYTFEDIEKTKKGGGNIYFNPLTRKNKRRNHTRNTTQKIKTNM